MVVVRVRAWWTLLRKQSGWGEMARAGFGAGSLPASTAGRETPQSNTTGAMRGRA